MRDFTKKRFILSLRSTNLHKLSSSADPNQNIVACGIATWEPQYYQPLTPSVLSIATISQGSLRGWVGLKISTINNNLRFRTYPSLSPFTPRYSTPYPQDTEFPNRQQRSIAVWKENIVSGEFFLLFQFDIHSFITIGEISIIVRWKIYSGLNIFYIITKKEKKIKNANHSYREFVKCHVSLVYWHIGIKFGTYKIYDRNI